MCTLHRYIASVSNPGIFHIAALARLRSNQVEYARSYTNLSSSVPALNRNRFSASAYCATHNTVRQPISKPTKSKSTLLNNESKADALYPNRHPGWGNTNKLRIKRKNRTTHRTVMMWQRQQISHYLNNGMPVRPRYISPFRLHTRPPPALLPSIHLCHDNEMCIRHNTHTDARTRFWPGCLLVTLLYYCRLLSLPLLCVVHIAQPRNATSIQSACIT